MSGQDLNILLIEDNKADARLIEESLKDAFTDEDGLAFRWSQRLIDGLDALRDNPADLVLLDLSLPDATGLDSLRRFVEAAPDLPVVVITGMDDDTMGEVALHLGAQDYLVKGRSSGVLWRRAIRYALARKADAEALRQRAEEFRNLIEGSIQGVCIHADLKPLFVNRAFAALFGYDDADDLARLPSLLDLGPREERSRIAQLICMESCAEQPCEFRGERGDGTQIWLESRISRVAWRGRPAWQWVAVDITARKEAERRLADRMRQQEALAELGRVGLSHMALGAPLEAAVELVHRVTAADCVGVWQHRPGRRGFQLRAGQGFRHVRLDEVRLEAPDSLLAEVVASRQPMAIGDLGAPSETAPPSYAADEGLVGIAAAPIPDPQGLFGVLCCSWRHAAEVAHSDLAFLQAITAMLGQIIQREHVEERLRRGERLEAVGKLTGGVAHDFNNLLTVVLGNLELLEAQVGPGSVGAKLTAGASAAARRAAKTVQQLLTFARQQRLAPEVLDLSAAVRDMLGLLHQSVDASMELDTMLADGLPEVHVDRGGLENALLNLVGNARDALSAGGRLVITTSAVPFDSLPAVDDLDAAVGPFVLLQVSDSGKGMSPEVCERAFEPFFTTKDVGEGTGLGLASVHGFVKQSGGLIGIESEPGRGTTVRLLFPVADTAGDAVPADDGGRRLAQGSETILVVEDDENVRAVTRQMLERFGYHVVEAPDAAQALALLERDSAVDLVLTDMVMPGEISGHDLAVAVQERFSTARVLCISGYAQAETVDAAGRAAPAFLQKPFTQAELAGRVRQVLDG